MSFIAVRDVAADVADAPTVIDIFAGCGGFGFGFAQNGFRIAHAVEGFRPPMETYVANVPLDEWHLSDIRKIDWDKIAAERPDVLIGGPPCEAFTIANPNRRKAPLDRLYTDPVGGLTLHFIKIAKALAPRAFIMENVPPILELERELRMLFSRNGFPQIHFHRLLAEDHGTPSHRERVFISNLPLAPPKSERKIKTAEAIGDLTSLDVDVPNHVPPRLGKKQLAAVTTLEDGDSAYRYQAADGRGHGNWTRLLANRLAPTVKGQGRFVHPTEDRLLTPREHARLMGYPDDFVFHGSVNETYDMIGESVPPPLSGALAREAKRLLDNA